MLFLGVSKKLSKNIKNSFEVMKKGLYLHPQKTGMFFGEQQVHAVRVFSVVLRGLKKLFQKKQKNIAWIKKGFYICTRLRDKRLRETKKSS
ncbi:MAG TPA: hypothetical protein DHV22_13505 [Xanthomarina gelatinilytica]|uniref:Uncharacterized protein n=1 Tax=Xanthomarina gelatinilytica TaxID=1137281 RepID=A0A3D6BU86_9FLAO|nr:hypothetical protein [Xanthomarina gelatinilytica]